MKLIIYPDPIPQKNLFATHAGLRACLRACVHVCTMRATGLIHAVCCERRMHVLIGAAGVTDSEPVLADHDQCTHRLLRLESAIRGYHDGICEVS